MPQKKTWYRVIDPLSPLYGCDLAGWESEGTGDELLLITALRRLHVLIGNRPFQMTAPDGSYLGLSIVRTQLAKSPIQDDVIEIGHDSPYGRFIEEEILIDETERLKLQIVSFEKAYQAVLTEVGNVLASRTFMRDQHELGDYATEKPRKLQLVISQFKNLRIPVSDIVASMKE